MRKLTLLFICFSFMLLIGCKEEQQKPEAGKQATEVSGITHELDTRIKRPLNMTVHFHVKEQQVYMECIVTPNFHFTEMKKKKKHGEGRLDVYVDGKKIESFSQGAFILKDLPKGKHEVTVKLIHNDQSEYGLEESFDLVIK
ncbi:hypothetical protein [Sutcliffiella halmapala]|uniref:hypothetical protein n=1 Tax=Sutcliffiella halmapala TaxID=79882 RepID=UPI000994D812|nr:hypothetical protein [Sutcliffiella halmapala]